MRGAPSLLLNEDTPVLTRPPYSVGFLTTMDRSFGSQLNETGRLEAYKFEPYFTAKDR
jgi:hypothetical protein